MWACCHRGDCCKTGKLVMTHEEAALLKDRPSVRPKMWTSAGNVTALLGSPCPFWDGSCTVYDVRPYNCRRYMCGREGEEPFDPAPVPQKVLQIRGLRRQYAMNQKKAQKWARNHGWRDE